MSSTNEVDAAPGRRERKKLANRDAMQAAALDLFAERGFDATTVEDICAVADVAPSTFFRHFPSKEDVVLAGLSERLDDLLAAMAAQPVGVDVAAFVLGAVSDWRDQRRPAEQLRSEARLIAAEPALQHHLGRMLLELEPPVADLLESRFPDADPLDVQLAAAWFATSLRVVIREWSEQAEGVDVFDAGVRAILRLTELLSVSLGPPTAD